ncbi:MAG: 1-acyl-sn-glycerol-3-phosphate acyltransferase [Clostridia bacterium]|nr:1-acyl-sn-glycerol-3-phosphate acyltransferase [Clostridia bacterium]
MKRSPLYVFGRLLLIPIFKLLFFYQINGRENIPKDGAYILCSNHLSNCDPVFLAVIQKRQIYYMAKAELFSNPIMSWLYRRLGAFPVHRGAGDGKAINEAEKIVGEGKLLGIFIEGTRSKTGEFLRPKSGASIVAHQMQVPVIPICITPKNKKIKAFQKVIVSVGKPLSVKQLGLEGEAGGEAYRAASKMIMSEIQKLRENDRK